MDVSGQIGTTGHEGLQTFLKWSRMISCTGSRKCKYGNLQLTAVTWAKVNQQWNYTYIY